MERRTIEQAREERIDDFRKIGEERATPLGIFYAVVAGAVISYGYWNFSESPLLKGAFFVILLIIFSLISSLVLKLWKKEKSWWKQLAMSFIAATITYWIVSMFV